MRPIVWILLALAACGPVTDGPTGPDVDPPPNKPPIFRQPLGAGTALDVSENECLDLDVVVQDDDSRFAVIQMIDPYIDGARLEQDGDFTAKFTFCPTALQVDVGRFVLNLLATDDQDAEALKAYSIAIEP